MATLMRIEDLGLLCCPRAVHEPEARMLCAAVETAVAATFALHPTALRSKTRGGYLVAFARQAAMYLAHVVFGFTYSEVGRAFGRDRTTAAYACRLIEERRDDPAVDALLGALEAVCHTMRDGMDREMRS
jgi:chromosomal replication initiation ATPase DnaA